MDAAFSLDSNYRANFVRCLMQSVGCTYVCLWKYNPENYVFFFFDGLYYEDINTQLPSSRSLARTLFDEYRQSIILGVSANDQIPGLAFKNRSPYLELQELDLLRLASNDTQRRFYAEAGIRTAVFMGCRTGEIEVGLPNVPEMKVKLELRNWFPEDFSSQSQVAASDQDHQIIPSQSQLAEQINNPIIKPPTDANQNPLAASSSSSSLRSLSMDNNNNSPEYSSLLFNINNPTASTTTSSSHILSIINNNPEIAHAELLINPNNSLLQPSFSPNTTTTSAPPPQVLLMPHQQQMQAFASLRQTQFPSPESEEAAMTKAILAVLTSPSQDPTSSSSSASLYSSDHHQQQHHHRQWVNQKSSAFKNYTSSPSTSPTPLLSAHRHHHHRLSLGKNMFKRSVSFFRSLNFVRTRHRLQAAAASAAAAAAAATTSGTTYRPTTSTQLHHMISERKRREKLNESFQSLRSLLPPGTKKDKASVLNSTTEYLNTLKAQVDELSKRNRQLEAQVLSTAVVRSSPEGANKNQNVPVVVSSSTSTTDDQTQGQRVDVRIRHVSESTSEEAEIVDLQVNLRASMNIQIEDLVLRIIEFLKSLNHVSLMSMEANTQSSASTTTSLHRLTLRLRVEGSEWDESTFQEAVRRVVADLAQ